MGGQKSLSRLLGGNKSNDKDSGKNKVVSNTQEAEAQVLTVENKKNEKEKSLGQIFRELPGWEEKTGKQQMDNFVSLLKSENLLSVNESKDFYEISISLPYGVYKLHCTKNKFDLNCNRENPKGDYARITKLDGDLKGRGLYRITEKDAIELSEDLLSLFDKLGKNNVYKESMDYFKRINGRVSSSVKEDDFGRIWSFFGMFISSVLKDSTGIKTSWVWFSDSNNIDNRNCNSSAGSVCSNFGGSLEHALQFGYKSTGNFEGCRALYIEK